MTSVLYVLPSTAVGGAETRFYTIIRRMSGIRSLLMTHSVVGNYFEDLGIPVSYFDEYGCHSPLPLSWGKTLGYAKAISHIVKRERVDHIVGVMHVGTFYAAIARDLYRFSPPIIGTILGNISAYFHKEGRNPTILEKSLLWYLLRRPRCLVVSSHGVKEDLVENFGLFPGKVRVIPNGIDIEKVRRLSSEDGDFFNDYRGRIIVTACRLNDQKDFNTLLNAFRDVCRRIESKLVIVGDGELKEEILRSAKEMGIETRVLITGFRKNPFPIIRRADVFVLSSFFEGFGNVIVEAMALGVPVVASDCPSGPAEIIEEGISGYLVPVGNHQAMADRISSLLTDPALRGQIAAAGRLRVDRFGVDSMVAQLRSVIDGVN